jgi:hypothetical protein
LGFFLDIDGAFNNAFYDSMCNALVRHGVDCIFVLWITATLKGRVVAATLNGFSMRVDVSMECPQGTQLWFLGVDDLIARLSGGGIYIQGYANNICLLVVGKCQGSSNGSFLP